MKGEIKASWSKPRSYKLAILDHQPHQTQLGCKVIKGMENNGGEANDVGVISHKKEKIEEEKV